MMKAAEDYTNEIIELTNNLMNISQSQADKSTNAAVITLIAIINIAACRIQTLLEETHWVKK